MPILWRLGVAGLALVLCSGPAGAQHRSWAELIAAADSVGPDPGRFVPSRGTQCGAGVVLADSIRVSSGPGEYLLASRSMRTRGMFTYADVPAGSARFALHRVVCDEETGRPLTFVLERNRRYFYLVFSLRERPTYAGLSFPDSSGAWLCRRWDAEARAFAPVDCPVGGSKC